MRGKQIVEMKLEIENKLTRIFHLLSRKRERGVAVLHTT